MALAYTLQRGPGQVIAVLAGEADQTAADQFATALAEATTAPYREIVVDLRGLISIDSTSIGILLAARRTALCQGAIFRIAHPRGEVLRALQVAGVIEALNTVDPQHEAWPVERPRETMK
jgi:anti-anti-sigma factor